MLWQKVIGATGETAPIQFLSHSTVRASTRSPFNVDKPAGVQQGDLLIAFYYHNSSSRTLTPPAGWTSHISSLDTGRGTFGLYSLICGTSEPASYSFQSNDSSNQRVVIAAFRGGKGLFDVVGNVASDSSVTITAGSITATNDGLLLAYSSAENAPQSLVSGPSGMTERVLAQDAAPRSTLYDLIQPSGTTGNKTFEWSNSAGNMALLVQIY